MEYNEDIIMENKDKESKYNHKETHNRTGQLELLEKCQVT